MGRKIEEERLLAILLQKLYSDFEHVVWCVVLTFEDGIRCRIIWIGTFRQACVPRNGWVIGQRILLVVSPKISGVIAVSMCLAVVAKKKIESLETQIEKNDQAISDINEQLLAASMNQEGQKIPALSKQLADLEKENDLLFDQLEQQTELFDSIESGYDKMIKECERVE